MFACDQSFDDTFSNLNDSIFFFGFLRPEFVPNNDLIRSSGERGAGVEALRGARGADFEGYATVDRGVVDAGCFCFGQGSSVNDEKLLLVKGPFCFVFANESDKAPQYAISLAHMKCVKKAPKGGHFIVTLETNLGDVEYEMSFEKEDIATEFQEAVKKQAAVGQANEVKKVFSFKIRLVLWGSSSLVVAENYDSQLVLAIHPLAPWP